MTTTAKHLLSEIVAGLDGAYEGPWEIEEFQSSDARPLGLIVSHHGTIIAEIRGYLDSCGNRENADHIIKCSPDRVRAIAAYVEQLEKALEKIASETAATWVSDVARAALEAQPHSETQQEQR